VTTVIVLAGIILLILVASLALERRSGRRDSLPRKILHIGAGSVCAVAVYLVDDVDHLLIAALCALPAVAGAVVAGFLKDQIRSRRSWGMVYFVAVYAVLLWFFRNSRPDLVFYPMAVLAWADGLATLAGERFGKHTFRAGGDLRTIEGSLVFFTAAFFIIGFLELLIPGPALELEWSLPLILAAAGIATLAEAVSKSGRDNIWVPLAVVYTGWVFPDISANYFAVSGALILTAVAAYLAYRKSWLDAGGAVAACLLGWLMLISPMPLSIVPALLFFGLGTGFSVLPKRSESTRGSERPTRNAVQVMANGGAPVASLLLFFVTEHPAFLIGFLAGFAAALSDTSSSEIGTRTAGSSRSIIGWKPLKPGVSGGISLPGTLAGAVFAMVIPTVALVLGMTDLRTAVLVALVAFAANIADSLLGQFTQRKRISPDGTWEDVENGTDGNKFKGLRWMNNDAVNAVTVTFATIAAAALFVLI